MIDDNYQCIRALKQTKPNQKSSQIDTLRLKNNVTLLCYKIILLDFQTLVKFFLLCLFA